MSYVQAVSACCGCGRTFPYNPTRVPSAVVNGVREPVCRECVDAANPQRVAKGLEPIAVLPGAYDACTEAELW